ncbi:MAG TPA: sulfotransferase [Acidimicrobiales bacterium]|nr:sulfotransferase [Acidimicrobiales bacterium]
MAELPHFVIIGAMKAGTSTLYEWLTENAGAPACSEKEPGFFAVDRVWNRGADWYKNLFAPGPVPYRGGEASTHYSQPHMAEVAATRMRAVVPEARIIYLVRDPVERVRSHYRHDVLSARERRPFLEALRGNEQYLGASCYWSRLQPYLEHFPREQILVLPFDDIFGPSDTAWREVLDHVDLPWVPRPDTARNRTEDKKPDSAVRRWLLRHGLREVKDLVPRAAWQLGSRVLKRTSRQGPAVRALLDAELVIPGDALERLDQEAAALGAWLGREQLWPVYDASADGKLA